MPGEWLHPSSGCFFQKSIYANLDPCLNGEKVEICYANSKHRREKKATGPSIVIDCIVCSEWEDV